MKKIVYAALFTLAAGSLTAQGLGEKEFTASGTFVVPAGVERVTVEVVGAGGDGWSNGAGGGGGGGYAKGEFTVVPGGSHAVTVGEGGSGSVTEVKTLGISATAGERGFWYTTTPRGLGGGGAGGMGAGGTINNKGGNGGHGYWTYFGGGGGGAAGPNGNGGDGGNTILWTGICLTPGGAGGISGGAPGGNGGKGSGFKDVNCSVNDSSKPGNIYGGGGGAGDGNSGPASKGAGGYVRIFWCSVEAPAGAIEQEFCDSALVDNLEATGTAIKWYEMAVGGTVLPGNTSLVDGKQYYASQQIDGCESTERLEVTALLRTAEPMIAIDEFELSTVLAYDTYQWLKEEVIIPGATQRRYTVTENGAYSVLVTDEAGCSGLSDPYKVTNIRDTRLEDLMEGQGQIKVYPNPSSDIVYIQAPVLLNLTVRDVVGRVIATYPQARTVSLGNYSPGIYILHVSDAEGRVLKVERLAKY